MPRATGPVLPGVPHHVTLRGNNYRRLFSHPRDYRHFLFLIHRHLPICDVSIHAFCLMTNHVHLLVTPENASSLAAFIEPVAQQYAHIRHVRYETTGVLFEPRHDAVPIRSEKHLAVATATIDLNPERGSFVVDPMRYRWSTFRVHAGYRGSEHHEDLWTPSDWYNGLGTDRYARAEAYHDWADECRLFYNRSRAAS